MQTIESRIRRSIRGLLRRELAVMFAACEREYLSDAVALQRNLPRQANDWSFSLDWTLSILVWVALTCRVVTWVTLSEFLLAGRHCYLRGTLAGIVAAIQSGLAKALLLKSRCCEVRCLPLEWMADRNCVA